MAAIKFKNYTDESFSWKWNGNAYTFKAGAEMYMDEGEARHFAKHLIDRELNKLGLRTDLAGKRTELEALCLPGEESEVTIEEAVNLNEVKKRKDVKSEKSKKKVEEEFADLNQ